MQAVNHGAVHSMTDGAVTPPCVSLDQRMAALTAVFGTIAATRMQGLPLLHPDLSVEAVDFQICTDIDGEQAACGILITPWFMNLIWLPLQGQKVAALGQVREHRLAGLCFEFIGAEEIVFGQYEMCSLFSPMFEFVDQQAARATAQAILEQLRVDQTGVSCSVSPASPERRAFLFGRRQVSAGERI